MSRLETQVLACLNQAAKANFPVLNYLEIFILVQALVAFVTLRDQVRKMFWDIFTAESQDIPDQAHSCSQLVDLVEN